MSCTKATTKQYNFDVSLAYGNWVKNTSGKDSIFFNTNLGNCGLVYYKLPNLYFVDTVKYTIKVTDHYPFSIFKDTVVLTAPIWDTLGTKVVKLNIKNK